MPIHQQPVFAAEHGAAELPGTAEAARTHLAIPMSAAITHDQVEEVVEAIRDAIDPALPLGFGDVAYRPDQVMLLQADVSALHRDLGWEPRTGIADGIAETVAWYRANSWVFAQGEAPR